MRNWDSFANNDIAGNPTIKDDTCPQEQDYLDALAVAIIWIFLCSVSILLRNIGIMYLKLF